MSALHVAAFNGYVDVVKELIANGVDVLVKDKYGDTPLHDAARERRAGYREHIEVVRELIANGADVHAKNNDGSTPLDLAEHEEIRQLLIEYQNTVDIKEPEFN